MVRVHFIGRYNQQGEKEEKEDDEQIPTRVVAPKLEKEKKKKEDEDDSLGSMFEVKNSATASAALP